MLSTLRSSVTFFAIFTLITGVLYPLVITGAAQAMFRRQANGSLLEVEGRVVGSGLIGQSFEDARYFWGRPSATAPSPYHAAASSGSNLGPTNPALDTQIRARVAALRAAHPERGDAPVPVDLVTASASGLDPHISPAAALYQAGRVARARALPEGRVRALVSKHSEGRWLGLFGEPRVRVLVLNLALDALADARHGTRAIERER